jgi:hypothetical protein
LEQTFCKWFRTMKNDEKLYMQLRNIQQQIVECVDVYEWMLIEIS